MLVAYITLTLVTSFICSLMEAVILSVPPAFVALLEKQGRRSGQLLHSLHRNIDQPLAAILTLNTVANTVGAVGVGNEVHKLMGDKYLAVISGLLTLTILIFSEIVPKTLGAVQAKKLAPYAAYIISGMVFVTYPFVLMARKINQVLSGGYRHRTSREEMIAAAEIGVDEGVIHQRESRIIKNLLLLDTIKVGEIMTPRSVVNAFDINDTVGKVLDTQKPVRFSRIPLFDKNLDHVKGILLRYRLMEAASNDLIDIPLKELMGPIRSVSEETSVSAALDQFLKTREHLFIVEDEYGTVSGIVTLEDTIETLLGVEIVDESDSVEDMRQFALEQWRMKKKALMK
jgi:CBS domain containing-hemolysin-like protein